jgi:hypothetical protein
VKPALFEAEPMAQLTVTDKTVYPPTLKLESFTPKLDVRNVAGITVTSFSVELYANNNLVETKNFNGTLAAGQTTTVEFNAANFSVAMTYNFEYKVVSAKNNNMDIVIANNSVTTANATVLGFRENAIITDTFGFNNGNYPANFIPITDAGLSLVSRTSFPAPQPPSNVGARNTTHALWVKLNDSEQNAGKPIYLTFGEVDFNNVPNKELSFFYAYSLEMAGQTEATATTLKIESSIDWGDHWDLVEEVVLEKTPSTVPSPTSEDYFIPQSPNDYIRTTVSLADLKNKNSMLRINITPGTGGNSFWIDEISLSAASIVEPDEPCEDCGELDCDGSCASVKDKHISLNSIFPNPAKNYLTIDLKEDATVSIFTLDGIKLFEENRAEGSSNITFTVPSGTYILRTETPKGSATTKFIVE